MFTKFATVVHRQYESMAKGELFTTDVENLFEKYLKAFPAGTDPIYRKRSVHDCNCCKQFIRRIGSLVSLRDGCVVTVWDNLDVPHPYNKVAQALQKAVVKANIVSVFRTKEKRYGMSYNYDASNERHDHFCVTVNPPHYCADPATKIGEQDAIFQVCHRGLTELRLEDIDTILDLIENNALYRGQEHKAALLGFKELKQKFEAAGRTKNFVWENLNNRNARFRNTVIGTLLVDLAAGEDVDKAVRSFESKVAPMNYKRPTSVITQKMVEQAVEKLNELGLGSAIYRRYARLSDVSVNDVLFVDNDTKSSMKDGVAALLESSVKQSKPNLKNAVSITQEEFIRSVVPKAAKLEVLLENRHLGNFVSLTAPNNEGEHRLFKWDNAFAWSYDGNVADSVKQRVKAAGGNINAKLRVSLSWFNFDDLDLHCVTPVGNHIYWCSKQGILDVDMNAGGPISRNAVENLAFNTLHDGVYRVHVNQYRQRETIDVGFAIEVEFAGVLQQFSYNKAVKGEVRCFELTVKKGVLTDVKPNSVLTSGNASQEKWGVKTETLVPVALLLNSPNHWNGQSVGAKHTIFALKDCKNPESTRGIYNEFLRSDLDKHRKVFEVLGNKTKCQYSDTQISGLGFTAARNDSVTVVVNGNRVYSVSF